MGAFFCLPPSLVEEAYSHDIKIISSSHAHGVSEPRLAYHLQPAVSIGLVKYSRGFVSSTEDWAFASSAIAEAVLEMIPLERQNEIEEIAHSLVCCYIIQLSRSCNIFSDKTTKRRIFNTRSKMCLGFPKIFSEFKINVVYKKVQIPSSFSSLLYYIKQKSRQTRALRGYPSCPLEADASFQEKKKRQFDAINEEGDETQPTGRGISF